MNKILIATNEVRADFHSSYLILHNIISFVCLMSFTSAESNLNDEHVKYWETEWTRRFNWIQEKTLKRGSFQLPSFCELISSHSSSSSTPTINRPHFPFYSVLCPQSRQYTSQIFKCVYLFQFVINRHSSYTLKPCQMGVLINLISNQVLNLLSPPRCKIFTFFFVCSWLGRLNFITL